MILSRQRCQREYAGLPLAAYVWSEFGCEAATKLSIVQMSMSRATCEATCMALSISKGKVLVFTRGVLLPSGALLCWAAVAASGSSSSPVAVATSGKCEGRGSGLPPGPKHLSPTHLFMTTLTGCCHLQKARG